MLQLAVNIILSYPNSERKRHSGSPPSNLSRIVLVRLDYQPPVFFSQNKSVISNQPIVLFSQNKSAPATSHQPTEQALLCTALSCTKSHAYTHTSSSCH
jgi:hypothetical protein